MSLGGRRRPLLALRMILGLVVVWQSVVTLLAGFHAGSWHEHLAPVVRGLAVVEIVAALLFLIPATARVGGRLLMGVFAIAIALHALHGEWGFGALVVYATAVWVVLAERPDTLSPGRVEGIAH